jgi:single-strand DNA-binding protein
VLVEGRMQPDPKTGGPRVWTGNDGVARASYEVTALDVRFLGGRQETQAASLEAPAAEALGEEDVPF